MDGHAMYSGFDWPFQDVTTPYGEYIHQQMMLKWYCKQAPVMLLLKMGKNGYIEQMS